MIKKVVSGDVFQTDAKHIAYSINTQGYNDSGFAGQVAQHAPQLQMTGQNKLGTVVSSTALGKTFHGLVCHFLEIGGWEDAPKAITECLDNINVPDNEPIAVVLMGAGMIGRMSGADVRENVKAIHRSKKHCILYTLEYAEEAILEVLKVKQLN